jgi:hypothetical protein
MDIHELRLRRRETLARDDQIRTWMNGVRRFAEGGERVDAFVFSGSPSGFQRWGMEGALKYFYERGDLTVRSIDDAGVTSLMETRRVALLTWDGERRRLDIAVRSH